MSKPTLPPAEQLELTFLVTGMTCSPRTVADTREDDR
jgi:hypothetical protein